MDCFAQPKRKHFKNGQLFKSKLRFKLAIVQAARDAKVTEE